MHKYWKLGAAVVGCELVGILGTPFTIAAIPSWYAYLNKPPFSPPNWIFGPVWTLLYFLMGVALWIVLISKKSDVRDRGIRLFAVQLVLNFLWSVIFFGMRQPLAALVDIALLWAAILATILTFRKVSSVSAYLLIPYLIWVSFASILNFAIVLLN
ncbi:tryptophan-rich sensory protein [Candidatus Microgenomates bacterium]|nr:tryptophan-rich sensory protein [Candidatus Microgenomates bacterium]